MKRLHRTLFISLSMLALSACQSVADDVRSEEPTCNNIQAQCLIAWDRYLNLTESAYQTCMSHSGRCEEGRHGRHAGSSNGRWYRQSRDRMEAVMGVELAGPAS